MILTVLDTGPLAAALNANDRRHAECASLLVSLPGRRILPGPVMTEVRWLLERRPKAEAAFPADVARGTFELVHPAPSDLNRMGQPVVRYADFPLGAADASVVAAAERFGAGRVATLDRRRLNAARPAHLPALTPLPDGRTS